MADKDPSTYQASAPSQDVQSQEARSEVREPGLEGSTPMWNAGIPSGNFITVPNACLNNYFRMPFNMPSIVLSIGKNILMLKSKRK